MRPKSCRAYGGYFYACVYMRTEKTSCIMHTNNRVNDDQLTGLREYRFDL